MRRQFYTLRFPTLVLVLVLVLSQVSSCSLLFCVVVACLVLSQVSSCSLLFCVGSACLVRFRKCQVCHRTITVRLFTLEDTMLAILRRILGMTEDRWTVLERDGGYRVHAMWTPMGGPR